MIETKSESSSDSLLQSLLESYWILYRIDNDLLELEKESNHDDVQRAINADN
jgi:hypothetical protein